MNFPFLTIITFTPIVAGVIILLTPKERKTEIKSIAAIAAFVSMVLSLYVFATYFSVQAADPTHAQYQFQEGGIRPWVPALGIGYHVGGDGINLTMLILTGIVSFMGVLISWGINERPREFFSFFMFLVAGVYGVFVSLDLFLLLFFYELSIFPMYFLIANWGSTRKEYAAMKLTLYLLVGSIIAMIGLLAIYFSAQLSPGSLLPG